MSCLERILLHAGARATPLACTATQLDNSCFGRWTAAHNYTWYIDDWTCLVNISWQSCHTHWKFVTLQDAWRKSDHFGVSFSALASWSNGGQTGQGGTWHQNEDFMLLLRLLCGSYLAFPCKDFQRHCMSYSCRYIVFIIYHALKYYSEGVCSYRNNMFGIISRNYNIWGGGMFQSS